MRWQSAPSPWRNCRLDRTRFARNEEQSAYDERAERARRLEILQRAESEFDPVPFDAEAARIFGRVTAAVIAAGRKPRGRVVDLMIAASAIGEGLPLYTTNPADFAGLGDLVRIVPVTRPSSRTNSQLAYAGIGQGPRIQAATCVVIACTTGAWLHLQIVLLTWEHTADGQRGLKRLAADGADVRPVSARRRGASACQAFALLARLLVPSTLAQVGGR